MTPQLNDLQTYWTPIAPFLSLRNEAEYDAAVVRLNALLDEVGTNQLHPLYDLLDTLGSLVHTYEQQHHAIPSAAGPEVLEFLLEEHGLAPNELTEIGAATDIQQYLDGKLELNVNQIRTLSKRFHVSPAAFI
jgi:HTH-type transcriptional regulator / antitoxin HigA